MTRFLAACFLFLLAATAAGAHPHVLVDAKAEIVFDAGGRIAAVRNIWQFDDAFSAYATQGLDADNDQAFSDEELAPLAKVNIESLSEFDFFTFLTRDDAELPFVTPTEYFLTFEGGKLTLFYTLPLKEPAEVGRRTTLEVFDPEYFVAFNFVADNPVAVVDAPAGCTAVYHPPEPLDENTASMLGALPPDMRDIPQDLQDAAASLANMIEISCGDRPVAVAAAEEAPPAPGGRSPFGIATPDAPGGAAFGGPLGPVFIWIAERQAEFYRQLTSLLSAIKADGSAVFLLLLISFVYGVFHAAGPGHGKAVISAYLVSSGETVRRGVLISFASAFVQALTAILVVGIATVLIGVTAQGMTAATNWLEIVSYAAIALMGAWLVWSKAFGGGHHHHHHHHHHHVPLPAGAAAHIHDHGSGHAHMEAHHDGHRHHGPGHDHAHAPGAHAHAHDHAPVRAAAPAASGGVAAALARAWAAILAVGIRPCSGAIIVLVFAVSQGLFLAGIAATFVMALGTGLTVAVLAALAVGAKGFAVRLADAESGRAATVVRIIEIAGGVVVLLFGLLLLGGALQSGMAG